jgi:hypothetical protein
LVVLAKEEGRKVYLMAIWSIYINDHFGHFLAIWYILYSFGTFFRFWYHAPRKIWQPRYYVRQKTLTENVYGRIQLSDLDRGLGLFSLPEQRQLVAGWQWFTPNSTFRNNCQGACKKKNCGLISHV